MSIDRRNFEEIDEADMAELVNGQVPENVRLEYKRDTYGGSDVERKEFLKDVTALANNQGGHLIIGIIEKEGVAVGFSDLDSLDFDAEVLRLESLANSGIEPRILNLRIAAVHLSSGGSVIVVRVPSGWGGPHRVIAKGTNRFYVRHNAGVHEPDVNELRVMFSRSADALALAREFHEERLTRVQEHVYGKPLVENGRLILHIIPAISTYFPLNIDVDLVSSMREQFPPVGSFANVFDINYYGVISERGQDKNFGYTQVFRNGII